MYNLHVCGSAFLVPILCEAKFCGVLWTSSGGGARLRPHFEVS